ncbi:MAG: PspC domain-containing protein [Ignavibacteriaceae bacterium]|nr:PspC domain-containing protein [Ignavibacteriaceae bacterium]
MHKKLYRSARERMLGGVAAGLADYFDVDPTIVRLVFVLSVFAGGAGLIAYIIMWIIIPQGPFVPFDMNVNVPPQNQSAGAASDTGTGEGTRGTAETGSSTASNTATGTDPNSDYFQSMKNHHEKRGVTFGIILVVLGIFLLADSMMPGIHFHDIFPVALMVAGIVILLNAIYK